MSRVPLRTQASIVITSNRLTRPAVLTGGGGGVFAWTCWGCGFAPPSGVAWGAAAKEIGHKVHASASIFAHHVQTVIYVEAAVLTCEAITAEARGSGVSLSLHAQAPPQVTVRGQTEVKVQFALSARGASPT